jgi:cell division topological specificity factor
MIEFFNKLFGRQTSGATAKERLRLVLMSDHLSLAPDMIDAMKRDLVDVISRYVEVDRERIDVHFEHQDKALAMLANIPITGVNRNGSNGEGGSTTAEVPATADAAAATPAASSPANAAPKRSPKRKRKKASGGQSAGAPAPAT